MAQAVCHAEAPDDLQQNARSDWPSEGPDGLPSKDPEGLLAAPGCKSTREPNRLSFQASRAAPELAGQVLLQREPNGLQARRPDRFASQGDLATCEHAARTICSKPFGR